jgi:1-deoxy-D-xylulose-5-phosphate reductoisomerase
VANEEAVKAFLKGDIRFTDITKIIEHVLSKHKRIERPSLDEVEEMEAWTKDEVMNWLR